jgi:hypothetical protein
MYRPQFVYPLPPSPCFDQKTQLCFDRTNLPVFLGSLAAGVQTGRIPLHVDKEGEFLLRGISTIGKVSFRLEDCRRNAISDSENTVNSSNFEFPNEYSNTSGAGLVALESGDGGLHVPAGGTFFLYLLNPGTVTIDLTTCAINLHGIKRYPGEVCP